MKPKELIYDYIVEYIVAYMKKEYTWKTLWEVLNELDKKYAEAIYKLQDIWFFSLVDNDIIDSYVFFIMCSEIHRRYWEISLHRDIKIEAQLIRTLFNNDNKLYEIIRERYKQDE